MGSCAAGGLYGYLASVYERSPRRGKVLLRSHLLWGFGICIAMLALIARDRSFPIFENEGTIESVRVQGSSKRSRTNLEVRVPSGGQIVIHASGRSTYFRLGERLKVRYQGITGAILRASFISADGREEGVFNGSETWPPYFVFIFGALIVWAGLVKYRRYPEGTDRC